MTLSDYALDCETPRVEAITEPESQKIYVDQHQSQIARLQYPAVIVGYGPSEETLPDASGIIKTTPNNVVRHEQSQLQIPGVALRMDGGWLVGSDRGEWGGELAYIGDDGNSRIVFEQNIDDIFRLGDKILVVSGVAHMMSNEGMVYRLTRGPGGGWLPAPWRALPGAPKRSRLTSDGRVLVNTYGGGAVLIDAQGGMSMAACTP